MGIDKPPVDLLVSVYRGSLTTTELNRLEIGAEVIIVGENGAGQTSSEVRVRGIAAATRKRGAAEYTGDKRFALGETKCFT